MDKLSRIYQNKWLMQGLGLGAFSGCLWFLAPLLEVAGQVPFGTIAMRLLVILSVVSVWVIYRLYQQLKTHRQHNQFADELQADPAGVEFSVDREIADEVGILSQRFSDAVQVLKKGPKAAYGKHYLYELPWYLLIGPPGSGKTTALLNSGLDFPLADTIGKGAVAGIGGTRNCDWWFTDQAVFLDTAGRYVTQDSHEAVDKAAWLGFLDLLKEYRPRRPLNGVLVTMSLADLLNFSAEERAIHAQAIRKRLEELHHHFGIRFPVYMIFTKVDLIAGFTDFFAGVPKEVREQVWGVTFPAEFDAQPQQVLARIPKDLAELWQRLNAHLLRRLQEERNLQRRTLLFGFPQRLQLIEAKLLAFLEECYRPNRYQSTPYLRGVYMTSATQEGTPIDRLMGVLAQHFKLNRSAVPLFSGQGKSFFLARLLKQVVFAEALLVGTNPKLERRQRWLRRGVYTALAGLILLMSGLWAISYNKNQRVIDNLDQELQQLATALTKTPAWQTDLPGLAGYLDNLQSRAGSFTEPPPFLMTLGLYQGHKLKPVATQAYQELLQKQLLPRLKTGLEQTLHGSSTDPDKLYSVLELYLMLGQPDRLQPELMKVWFALEWQQAYSGDTQLQTRLMSHLTELLAQGPEPQVLNERLIAATRQILQRIPAAQQLYLHIKTSALQNTSRDLQLAKVLGPHAGRVFLLKTGSLEKRSIPYLFTYEGFYNFLLQETKRQTQESIQTGWVLGTAAKAEATDPVALQQAILTAYYQDYMNCWDALIADLKLQPARTPQQAAELVEFMVSPESPLQKLLETIRHHTNLAQLPQEALEQVQEAAAKTNNARVGKLLQVAKAGAALNTVMPEGFGAAVAAHFAPLNKQLQPGPDGVMPFTNILELLTQLYGYLIDVTDPAGSAGKLAGNSINPVSRLQAEAARSPEPLKSLLQQLATGNRSVILENTKEQLSRLWHKEVWEFYRTRIRGKYPFNHMNQVEVSLADFSQFFSPQGLLAQFFDKNLSGPVDATSHAPQAMNAAQLSRQVSSATQAQLSLAAKIRQMFFANAGDVPQVRFKLKPVNLDLNADSFWLDLDGQPLNYRHTEAAQDIPVQWPGLQNNHSVSFGFTGKSGQKPVKTISGDWSWFKLLSSLQVQKLAPGRYLLTFILEGLQARYELTAGADDYAVDLAWLAQFQLSEEL